MGEITQQRINNLRSAIHQLRIFINYSNSMKKKELLNQDSINKNKKFNEDKILKTESKSSTKVNYDVTSKNTITSTNSQASLEGKKNDSEIDNKIRLLPGDCIINQGEKGNSAFLIISGSFNVEIDKKVVGAMSSGEMFGELSLILGENRKATVRAITGSELVEINPNFLKDYMLETKIKSKKISKSKLETQKIIKSLSVELGKKNNKKMPVLVDEVNKTIMDESTIIKSLIIQLHKRLEKMIYDQEKDIKVAKLNKK